MTGQLMLLAAGTLVSEDLACVAAGALVAKGDLSLASAAFACAVGIFAGDIGLYAAGHFRRFPAVELGAVCAPSVPGVACQR